MTTTPTNPSIKTDIFDFCQTFAGILKPFAQSLEDARTSIQKKGDADVLQRPLAGFSDVHHRLESLIHKVEEQQAYLIIFGPLKSGKSTLMNAISAAYVSEVSSLPAYPCLVHVKHGDDYSFVASRYSGEKLRFTDNASLQALIEQSHKTLAERLHEVEERGEKFDPGVHYPEAIRRVDVAVPTRNMRDSLTVLVDTPGLYTRMKFGYDLMTREFRNSAACAVFVVKTDNLFLEQVFEEFNELLDLFSRIFIVVNIDSNKRDLDPDGSLKPSLESRSPGEVIRAFESLVMSAPLRRAQKDGRLKIYPIDLLNSASNAMRQTHEVPPTDEPNADEPNADEPNADDAAETKAQPAATPATKTTADDITEAAATAGDVSETETPADPATETKAPADDDDITASETNADTTTETAAVTASPAADATTPSIDVDDADDAAPLTALSALSGAPAWRPLSSMPVVAEPMAIAESPAVAAEQSEPDAAADDSSVMPATWSDHPEASFSLFLKDLTDYLNSSDYLHEFMGDALLMGANLGTEIQDHCSQKATESLKNSQKILAAELTDTEARLKTVENLRTLDIKESFTQLRGESRKHAEEVSKSAVVDALQKSLKQLEDWFDSDASVSTLQDEWSTLLGACAKRVGSECQLKLRSLVASPLGGIRISETLRSSAVGIDELLGPVVAAARANLGNNEPKLENGPFQIEPEHLKVRKSIWDWFAFRSLTAVRRRIFGKSDTLDRAVPAMVKDKRLGQEGRQALEEGIISELSRRFPSEAVRVSDALLTTYSESLGKDLTEKLNAAKDQVHGPQGGSHTTHPGQPGDPRKTRRSGPPGPGSVGGSRYAGPEIPILQPGRRCGHRGGHPRWQRSGACVRIRQQHPDTR